MKTSIVILTYNKLEYTQQCIESIRKYTAPESYEIIVVDNRSTDGTVEWLSNQNDIKTILNNDNLGFPKGCNQGIEISTGDNVLLLNNDTIVTHNWLDNLLNCLYSNEKIGAVGPVTNSAAYYQSIPVNYNSIEEMIDFARTYNIPNPSQWEERIKLIGFCLLVKREVINKIGLLDELFSPGNYEDDDYSFRILNAGYKLILCKDTFIHHFGSVSFKENQSSFISLLQQNKDKFIRKWGFDPVYSTYIRDEIIQLIQEPEEKNLRILEVGCGCGASLLKIKNLYRNTELHGIELNSHSASIASHFADIKAFDIQTLELGYDEASFDYIILADVLEHLYDPWNVVNNLKRFLKKSGKLLISIPNVSHYSVIRDLLNGDWTYTDAGILDRTHVRFFTLNEVNKMLLEAGYKKIEYSMNKMHQTKEDEDFIEALCKLTRNKQMNQQFQAYQYIVKACIQDYRENLKIILRRIENDIDIDNSQRQVLEWITDGVINTNDIIEVVKVHIIKKAYLLNLIATICFQGDQMENVIPLLQASLEINNKNSDTLYNIGYILYKLNELEMALSFLEEIENKDEEVLSLINQIKG